MLNLMASNDSSDTDSSTESSDSPTLRNMEVDQAYFNALANGFTWITDEEDEWKEGETVRKSPSNKRIAVDTCPETHKQVFL